MNLQDYINSFNGKKVKVDIVKRWQERVVGFGLDKLGADGATQYLVNYGKGIGADKVSQLAMQATAVGAKEMAEVFWARAYELEFGRLPDVGERIELSDVRKTTVTEVATPHLPFLPDYLQPGKLITMQPIDAKMTPEQLIENDDYCAQAKRDGNKYVIYATKDKIYYQSRSMAIKQSPDIRMEAALKKAAASIGNFVIETEVYFLSESGREHRTGAQAATWNLVTGGTIVKTKCAVFGVLYANNSETTIIPHSARLIKARKIGTALQSIDDTFEPLEIAFTEVGKAALYQKQKEEKREGIVWANNYIPYCQDKAAGQEYVRTKFLTDMKVKIRGLTPTTAQGKLFGAIQVEDEFGNDIGSVGIGFSREDEAEIKLHFDKHTNPWIEIATQGLTENGQVYQARYGKILFME